MWHKHLEVLVVITAIHGCAQDDHAQPDAPPSVEGGLLDVATLPMDASTAGGAIGAEGGTIALGKALLVVPRGALSQPVVITMALSALAIPPGYAAYSPLYQFGPAGLQFAMPVIVSLPFYGSPAAPTLVWSSSRNADYVPIQGSISGSNLVAQVSHFSLGFVGERIDAGPVVGDERVDGDDGAEASLGTDASMGPGDANRDRTLSDARLTPAGPGVSCGNTVCAGATPQCCVPWSGGPPTCTAAGACRGIEQSCDGVEDCASNEVCCFNNLSTRCGPANSPVPCEAWNTSWGAYLACHSDADCPSETAYCELEGAWLFTVPICHSACADGSDCYVAPNSRFPFPLHHPYYPTKASAPDAGVGWKLGQPDKVNCGSTSCAVPQQFCCGTDCFDYPTLCRAPANLRCDGPEDCSGTTCCIRAANPFYASCSACSPSPLPSVVNSFEAVVCHADADCPNAVAPFCISYDDYFSPGSIRTPIGICTAPCLGTGNDVLSCGLYASCNRVPSAPIPICTSTPP